VKREEGNTNSPKLSLLKILSLAYHHSHFLAATLDFTSFFIMAFLGPPHTFFIAGLFWIRFDLLEFNIILLSDTNSETLQQQGWQIKVISSAY